MAQVLHAYSSIFVMALTVILLYICIEIHTISMSSLIIKLQKSKWVQAIIRYYNFYLKPLNSNNRLAEHNQKFDVNCKYHMIIDIIVN